MEADVDKYRCVTQHSLVLDREQQIKRNTLLEVLSLWAPPVSDF